LGKEVGTVRALGYHLLIEFYGCDHDTLNRVGKVKNLMDEAAIISGASIVESVFHRFNPHGVSGVVVIAESHLAIHTWPEYSYAAIDLFTCGEKVDPWKAFDFLKKGFRPESTSTKEIMRGDIPGEKWTDGYGPIFARVEGGVGEHL
jgi:S-adenosylmethionine decarboxylase proenzyme